jgi:IS30 family transposase
LYGRYKIVRALDRARVSVSAIGRQLGRDRRTIQWELKRGKAEQIKGNYELKQSYCADAGERARKERARNKGRPVKKRDRPELCVNLEAMVE